MSMHVYVHLFARNINTLAGIRRKRVIGRIQMSLQTQRGDRKRRLRKDVGQCSSRGL